MVGTFLWNFIKIRYIVSEKQMFKEKVNARTDARRTTDHDVSSDISGAKNHLKDIPCLSLYHTIPTFDDPEWKIV